MLYFRPTSRKLSDLSSVLDEKSVYEALNNSQKRSYENRDDSLVVTGTNYYFRIAIFQYHGTCFFGPRFGIQKTAGIEISAFWTGKILPVKVCVNGNIGDAVQTVYP